MPTIQTVCIEPLNFSNTYGVLQGVQVTIDNTNRLYCRWFKLPPTIQTVCIVIDNTNRLYCSWLAIQTVCIVVGLQYKRFVLSAPQYKPFVLSSMQYKLFVLQLRATIQTVCISGGSSYHTCFHCPKHYCPEQYHMKSQANSGKYCAWCNSHGNVSRVP